MKNKAVRKHSLLACTVVLGALLFCSCRGEDKSNSAASSNTPSQSNPSSTPSLDFAPFNAIATKASTALLAIQKNDGGWGWYDTPANLTASVTSPTTDLNMFGVAALGLADAYLVAPTGAAYTSIQKTAQYLLNKTLTRTSRLYATDCLFLIKAAQILGDLNYRDKGYNGQVIEKEFAAALYTYNTSSPTDAQVTGLTQAQIDVVTSDQLVSALRSRFVAAGRNAGLRAYDWLARMQVAHERGDTGFFQAIAQVVASDYAQISQSDPWYRVGLAATIIILNPLKSNPSYANVIESAKTKIFAEQSKITAMTSDVSIQEVAFVVQALTLLGEKDAVHAILSAAIPYQLSAGYFLDAAGKRTPEFESEFVSAVLAAIKAFTL